MTKEQKQVLDKAARGKLKTEAVLTGGSKYVNPIRKPKKPSKKTFLERLFSQTYQNEKTKYNN